MTVFRCASGDPDTANNGERSKRENKLTIMKTLKKKNSIRAFVRHNAVGCAVLPLLCGLSLIQPPTAGAVGLRLPNQDPEAIARGNAFVATADNPSAIYYNPAGITQLQGDQVRAGLYVISADTEFTSSLTGGKAHTDTTPQVVPQLHYVHTFKKAPISLGLGVYAPFGLGLEWKDKPVFDSFAHEGSMLYATVSPVIAWRAHPTFSIAVGPTISYSDVKLESASFKFRGDDVGLGFKAGMLWQPHRQWSFGASYQSGTDLEYSGHSSSQLIPLPRSSTTADAHFPQFVVAGVSFRPTTNWNFEFDLDWTDWDSLNSITFQRSFYSPVFAFNYTSSLMYEFGVTRQLGKGWYASVGYIYSENSSPDADYSPLVNDDNLHLGSVGFGHRGQRWDWAFGYHFAYNGSRTVTGSNSGTPFAGAADGTYKTFNNAFNVAVTFKF